MKARNREYTNFLGFKRRHDYLPDIFGDELDVVYFFPRPRQGSSFGGRVTRRFSSPEKARRIQILMGGEGRTPGIAEFTVQLRASRP